MTEKKNSKPVPRLAIVGAGYIVSLVATLAFVPPETARFDVVAPTLSAASLMLFFGPYLLAAGCTTGFLPSPGSLWCFAAVLPFCLLHVAFLSAISKRTSLWRFFGGFGERVRKTVVCLFAAMSVLGVWYEMPEVTRYEVAVDGAKIPAEGLRFVLATDLHSCRYGRGQRALTDAIDAQKPDAIVLSGDIFDDRLPDGNTRRFLAAVGKKYPCFYMYGNHEHWSERIIEIKNILIASGVKVLDEGASTAAIGGVDVDFCGLDDPTYMVEGEWESELAAVADATAGSPRLKVLVSHRPEYPDEYAKYDFDLIFSGHMHGGQWRIPGLDMGVCGPSSGGPDSGSRMFFPRRTGGAYPLNDRTRLVVSRGLARESTPLPRFFNHPELVVVDLRAARPR